MDDYYKILGVDRGASSSEIKRAFRKMALKYHPDKSDDPDTVAKFQKAAEAYEALVDDKKRKSYDEFGSTYQQEHASTFDFNKFYSEFQESMKAHKSAHKRAHEAATGGIFDDLWDDIDLFGDFENMFSEHDLESPSLKYQESANKGQKCRTITKKSGNSVTTHTVCTSM